MLNRLDLRGVDDPVAGLPRPPTDDDGPLTAVRSIIAEVRDRGDAALLELTERFDGVRLDELRVPATALRAALEAQPPEVRDALELARDRIERHHRAQLRPPVTHTEGGVTITSSFRAVDRAGCYVPGGRAAYPSTLLMTAVPARVAGVGEVVVCVPPDRATGAVTPVTLAAAAVAGVDEVHAVGGAQAVAAMAHGTASIRPVDVICGPGNRYVALAKQEVAGVVGIAAAFAGPSEVVVVADATVPADFAAVDVILQAEHGPDGLAWLVTWDPDVADAVDEAVDRLTAAAPRREEITATLARSGYAVVVDSPEAAMAVANHVAPEHLELLCGRPEDLVPLVRNAGAVFCGPWSPASIGDYLAGPSHVLPTDGTARFASALTVDDFCKHHHVVTVSPEGFDGLAPAVEALAAAEGLDAHAESVRLRRRVRGS
jgi:histidinol dehydrogenase